MLKFAALILGVHLSFTLQGQSIKDVLYFQVICGAGAQSSTEIDSFKLISSLKDSAEIKKKLFTGSDIEQVLSAILLIHYSSNDSLMLFPAEAKKIKNVTTSRKKFQFCFTCTYHEKGSLRQFFRKKYAAFEIIEIFLLSKGPFEKSLSFKSVKNNS